MMRRQRAKNNSRGAKEQGRNSSEYWFTFDLHFFETFSFSVVQVFRCWAFYHSEICMEHHQSSHHYPQFSPNLKIVKKLYC